VRATISAITFDVYGSLVRFHEVNEVIAGYVSNKKPR